MNECDVVRRNEPLLGERQQIVQDSLGAKYTYSFWRPVTAIRDGGNPALIAEPAWTPLAVTPNHPEYPAAHGCVTGTVSSLIKNYFGTRKVHMQGLTNN